MQAEPYMLGSVYPHNNSHHHIASIHTRSALNCAQRYSCQRRGPVNYISCNETMPSISPVQECLEINAGDNKLYNSSNGYLSWAPQPGKMCNDETNDGDFKSFGSMMMNILNGENITSTLDTTSAVTPNTPLSNQTDYRADLGYSTTAVSHTWKSVSPRDWNTDQVFEWMYNDVFAADFDGLPLSNLREFTGKDLVQMELKELTKCLQSEKHAKKLLNQIQMLVYNYDYSIGTPTQYNTTSTTTTHNTLMNTNSICSSLSQQSYPTSPNDSYNSLQPLSDTSNYPEPEANRTYNLNACQQYNSFNWYSTSRSDESDAESAHSTFHNSQYFDIPTRTTATAINPQKPHKRGPGRPRGIGKKKSKNGQRNSRLWEFIRDLLKDANTCPRLLKWEDRKEGVFRFVQSDQVAKLWGERKANPRMTYEKLSRAMRYYYKSNVLQPVLGRRLVYKFGPCATGWRPHEMEDV